MYKLPILIVTLVLTLFLYGSCKANQAGDSVVDWAKVEMSVEVAESSLASQAIAWEHKPELAKDLRQLAALMDDISKVLEASTGQGAPENFDSYLVAAGKALDALMLETTDPDLKATLSSVSLALSLARVLAA